LRVLNVGGGSKSIAIPAHYARFEHLLLDIDPKGAPDIVKDARELTELEPDQFEAIYCSHNLEHYFPHEVPRVLAGFLHVLKPDGFAEIRVPDLDRVMRAYVEKGLDIEDVLYTSRSGPILVRDVLYGFGKRIASSGQDYYAHKTGFSVKSITRELLAAGFGQVLRRPSAEYELYVLAFAGVPTDAHRALLKLRPGPA
jgi:SAM-dependent methyltransferase